MKLTSKERGALRLMADVAMFGDKRLVSLKDVATRQAVSVKYLEQIAPYLLRAGLLRSVRGIKGGYTLVKPPEHYSTGEILRAVAVPVKQKNDLTDAFSSGLLTAAYAYADSVSLRDIIRAQMYDNKRRNQAAYLLD